MELTYDAIAGRIDHALLTPTMTTAEMVAGCRLAAAYEVASVCIKPHAVALAARELAGSPVRVGTVIGFPHGGQATRIKVAETIAAVEDGAVEVDMVINIGAARTGEWGLVEDEIGQICRAAHERRALLKVIFETCYLTDAEKAALCQICGRAGVDYVKTSTGFGTGGATRADLILMRRETPAPVKLKASGGIKDLATAIEFAELGSERLGLSRTAEILEELNARLVLAPRGGATGSGGGIGSNPNY